MEARKFHGIKVATETFISHLFFVDDILILGIDSLEDWMEFQTTLKKLCLTYGIEVNCQK